jgi:hypothetical protein
MEAFDEGLLPWGAGCDIEGFDLFIGQPIADGIGDKLIFN